MISFYFTGLVAVIAVDAFIHAMLKSAIARGHIVYRRIMLIGGEQELAHAKAEIESARTNARVVATGVLVDSHDGGTR